MILCNPRQCQHVHIFGTRHPASSGAGRQGCACRHHIVDQQHGTVRYPVAVPCVHGDCISQGEKPLFSVLAFEHRRPLVPHQQIETMRSVQFTGHFARQQGRLVIAPSQESRPVQRHRHNQRVRRKQWPRCVRHPSTRRPGDLGTVSMFQGQNELPCAAFIHQRRTPLRPWARHCHAFVTFDAMPIVCTRQRRSTGFADRSADE